MIRILNNTFLDWITPFKAPVRQSSEPSVLKLLLILKLIILRENISIIAETYDSDCFCGVNASNIRAAYLITYGQQSNP